ncbi:MAG: FixH family protein [Rhodospirillales bacterium]
MSADTINENRTLITGRTVLLGMIAFFGIIIAVNSVFVYFALDTWPGLADEDSYNKGLDYNRQLEAAEAQRDLGWHSSLSYVDDGNGALLVATFEGPDGVPLGGLDVQAVIQRPVGGDEPLIVDFSEAGSGIYHSLLAELAAGRWDIELTAGDAYLLRYEIEVEP